MRAAPAFVLEVNRLTYRRCFRSRGERHFCFCSTIPGDDDISVSVFTSRCKATVCTNVMSRVSGRLANESAEPEERKTPPLMLMLERRARFFPHLAVVRERERPTPSLSPSPLQLCDSRRGAGGAAVSGQRWLAFRQTILPSLFVRRNLLFSRRGREMCSAKRSQQQ